MTSSGTKRAEQPFYDHLTALRCSKCLEDNALIENGPGTGVRIPVFKEPTPLCWRKLAG
jgi:hypothetical protein